MDLSRSMDANSLVLSGGITTSFSMRGTGATGINGDLFSEAGDNVLGGGVVSESCKC